MNAVNGITYLIHDIGMILVRYSWLTMLLLCVALTIIVFSLWRRYGKDDPVVVVRATEPPEGMNSLLIGHIYNGTSDNRIAMSLLFYLVSKGYVLIELRKDGDFILKKLKEYDGNSNSERNLMHCLFNDRRATIFHGNLNGNWYWTASGLRNSLDVRELEQRLYEKPSWARWVIKCFVILIAAVAMLLTYIAPVKSDSYIADIQGEMTIMFLTVCLTVMWAGNDKYYNHARIAYYIKLIVLAGILLASICLAVAPVTNFGLMIVTAGTMFALTTFYVLMSKRTKWGNKIYGEVLGFREYIEVTDKALIERFVEEDPAYFYGIMSYAYALNITDVWIERFSNMAAKMPAQRW